MTDSEKDTSPKRWWMLLALTIYLLLVLTPTLLTSLSFDASNSDDWWEIVMRSFGVAAFSVVAFQFILAARFNWIVKPVGLRAVMNFHKSMAVMALFLVICHIGLLIWIRMDWNLLLGLRISWPLQLGRIAFLSLICLLAISFGRRLLPINHADWKWFHNVLAWTTLLSGFVHCLVMGTSFDQLFFAFVMTVYFAGAILCWSLKRRFGAKSIP